MPIALKKQKRFLREWAEELAAPLNTRLSPQEQFKSLAINQKDWSPGDDEWCAQWKQCFGDDFDAGKTVSGEDAALDQLAATTAAMSLNTNPPTDSALDDLTNTTAAMSLNSKDPAGLSPAIDSGVEMDQLTAKTANVSLDDAAPAEGAPSTKSKSKKKKKKKSKAKKTGGVKIAAINEHFDREYGTDYTKLDMWQLLCVDVGIEPAPSSITQCKKALKSSLVNIYDFLSEERPVKQFQSYSQFVKYTRDGRLYPLDKAKEDSFAKMFLRSIPFYGYRH